MRRVRSRLTILLLILVIVTSLLSLTIGALVRNGILFQRDNMRYLLFGYAAKDILLLLVAVAAVAVLITVTSRSTTNPIRELSRAAREIAGGNYDVTVPERDRVEEFGELERNFNLMTAELRSNEYLRKDFISSVSHQLKTPLSILNGYAQLLAEGGYSFSTYRYDVEFKDLYFFNSKNTEIDDERSKFDNPDGNDGSDDSGDEPSDEPSGDNSGETPADSEKKGCKGDMGAGSIIAGAVVALSAVLLKKKEH